MKNKLTVLMMLNMPLLCMDAVELEYGPYSLPQYNVDETVSYHVFRGWDFQSVTIPETPQDGLQPVTVAHSLLELPGVNAGRRGASSIEPSIRGLGGDRVATCFNGLELPGGSPTHVAPVGFFFPGSVATISVSRSFPSVSGGPVKTSGRIDLDSPGPTDQPGSGLLAVTGRSGWEGLNAIVAGYGGSGSLRSYVALSGASFQDYRSGGGDKVDADVRTIGAAGSLAWKASETVSTNLAFVVNRQELVRNASLPLDIKDTPFFAMTLDTTWITDPAVWNFRLGYSDTEPYLTSEDRPKLMPAPIDLVTAEAKAKNLAGAVSRTSSLESIGTLELGIDFSRQFQDTLRTRFLASGNELYDHIWPDVLSRQAGVFGELRWNEPDRYQVTAGIRLDRNWSDARDADDPIVGLPGARGATIRENFAAFNSDKAGITGRREWAGAGHLVCEVPLDGKDRILYSGLGVVRASPGISQRYRAFLNALGGGMEVGNPALRPETRWDLDLGIRMRGESWRFDAGGFLARVDGFIQREAIQQTPLVYGFRNRDVELGGLEMIGEWSPPMLDDRGLKFDGSFTTVWAQNRKTSIGISEIPPWNLHVGLVWESAREDPRYRFRVGNRLVGSRDNPNPTVVPLYRDTDSFMVWGIEGRVKLPGEWNVELSLDNLFDERYFEYLQAPVATGAFGPSSGTLVNGDSIPGIGRQVIVSLRKRF